MEAATLKPMHAPATRQILTAALKVKEETMGYVLTEFVQLVVVEASGKAHSTYLIVAELIGSNKGGASSPVPLPVEKSGCSS